MAEFIMFMQVNIIFLQIITPLDCYYIIEFKYGSNVCIKFHTYFRNIIKWQMSIAPIALFEVLKNISQIKQQKILSAKVFIVFM